MQHLKYHNSLLLTWLGILNILRAAALPQLFTDNAFDVNVDPAATPAAEATSVAAPTYPTQDAVLSALPFTTQTGPMVQITGPKHTGRVSVATHFDDHALHELLSPESNLAEEAASDDASSTEDGFLEESVEETEPGIVPAYMAGRYFVAELNIGEQLLFLKIDTGSFHFWVLSDEEPTLCTSALQAGSGCYTANPSATPLSDDAKYTFKYDDGTVVKGKKYVVDSVAAPAIFGAAAWSSQLVVMPSNVTPWDGASGISGVLPLGRDINEFAASEDPANANKSILPESPLASANWHFFTTYFKPGSQMFVGFDYDPVDLYTGDWSKIPVAAINGSWFVQPDSTWTSQTSETASGGTSQSDPEVTETPEPTPATTVGLDTMFSTTLSADGALISVDVSGDDTTGGHIGDTVASIIKSLENDILATATEPVTFIGEPTQGSIAGNQEADGTVQGIEHDDVDPSPSPSADSKIARRQSDETQRLPILLNTGSVDTLLDANTVKSIYGSLMGSCVTLGDTLTNCTYPCTLNYTSFLVTPEYPASVELPWGSTSIPIDLTQFPTEIYKSCHSVAGGNTCSATCRGAIQPQTSEAKHHVYGTVVFRSAIFKWDTAEGGSVSMAPYADWSGESWFYE